jgi:hypothetical protein
MVWTGGKPLLYQKRTRTVEELHLRNVPNATCGRTAGRDCTYLTYQIEPCRGKLSEEDCSEFQVRFETREKVSQSKFAEMAIPLFARMDREMTLL